MSEKIYLNASFQEKDLVKNLGARFDGVKKKWYIPPGLAPEPFAPWLMGTQAELAINPVLATQTELSPYSITISELFVRIKESVKQTFPQSIWLRAEVHRVIQKDKFCQLEFAEIDAHGKNVASIRGTIWQSELPIIEYFEKTANAKLEAGIKLLVQVSVEVHPLYGIQLKIWNIDPNFTLGDMIAKIKAIKDALYAAGILNRNQQLPTPRDFTNIVIISPFEAAGLGDFQSSAATLEKYGLCQFTYLHAVFQSAQAPASINIALQEALKQPALPDAIILIRGGGAASDLHWLNDLKLAEQVCLCPIPIFTGIGHERDSTILDEIAHMRFSTPSKVATHIKECIKTEAITAKENWQFIKLKSLEILSHQHQWIVEMQQNINFSIQQKLQHAEINLQHFMSFIQQAIPNKLNMAEKEIINLREYIIACAPERILQRGFTLIKKGKTLIKSAKSLQTGDCVTIKFHDGTIDAITQTTAEPL